MAGYDPRQALTIFRHWPLQDLLLAYVELVLKPKEAHGYEFRVLLCQIRTAFGGKEKLPELPKILA